GRARLSAMGEAIAQGRELLALRRTFDEPDAIKKREAARSRLDAATTAKGEAEESASNAERTLQVEERGNAIAASLAAIVEHGEKFGRHDGHCPLCSSARTKDEFAIGLALARKRLEGLASGVAAARQQATSARESLRRAAIE